MFISPCTELWQPPPSYPLEGRVLLGILYHMSKGNSYGKHMNEWNLVYRESDTDTVR